MKSLLKLISIICGVIVVNGAQLPSFITPCSRSLPTDQLSACITNQARSAVHKFAKGLPELGLEPIDPLSLSDVRAKAGTFNIRSTNVVVKGLRNMEIREMFWDLEKNLGRTKLFGNLTFVSDYETEGRVLLIPINGNGKLTVKMYDTDMVIKYKIRKIKGADGVEHIETYDLKPSQNYGLVKIHMTNILGGSAIGDTVNQVMNENWRELMAEVGPPYNLACATKVHEVINKLYAQIPYDELLAP